MITPKYYKRVCMRFEDSVKVVVAPSIQTNERRRQLKNKITKQKILNLLFDKCDGCLQMAAIPQGAFAARKVRESLENKFLVSHMEKKGGNDRESKHENSYTKKNAKEEGRELTPLKYNSKLMNSIWGLYNRYSVHNFKKNTDADVEIVAAAGWGPAIKRFRPPTTSTVENSAAATIQQLLDAGNARF